MNSTSSKMNEYYYVAVEKYWQNTWNNYHASMQVTDPNIVTKPKKYILEMFPYPSGKIHMGHVRNYVLGDVLARYFLKKGYNVLHTVPWDAFGLPAENASQKHKLHPALWTHNNIATMRQSLQSLGLLCDWDLEFATCDLAYYKHQQKIFLDLYQAGFVYKKNLWVNWDPVDQTVLANEQVINGKGWRSGAIVEKKQLSQWMFKTTAFADMLLSDLEGLDWPEEIKQMQHKWIHKFQGFIITFQVSSTTTNITNIDVYSSQPETIYGASCLALSLHHPLVYELSRNNFALSKFVRSCEHSSYSSAKRGVCLGVKAIHPLTGKILPVYVANYVLDDYGTGAIFVCPAHDQRDMEFAIKYGLPIIQVIDPGNTVELQLSSMAYSGDGTMINSDFLNGLTVIAARKKIIEQDFITTYTAYKLHDWCISRQRYWGCPIPIIYCSGCGIVPAPLPVVLPEEIDLPYTGNPLLNCTEWRNVYCPRCGCAATRDTDTMDTFVDSSWYFLRICSTQSKDLPFVAQDVAYWLPVDYYIGGIEHAILHLLYARFMCKALNMCGYVLPNEPFNKLFAQGMVCHKTYKNSQTQAWLYPTEVYVNQTGAYTKEGNYPVIVGNSEAMSKSKHNLVTPEEIIQQYGADALRWFILSDTPPEKNIEWSSEGIEVSYKFIKKLWYLVQQINSKLEKACDEHLFCNDSSKEGLKLRKVMHQVICKVTDYIEQMHYNCAIACLYEYYNALQGFVIKAYGDAEVLKQAALNFTHLLSPFIPHIAEEMWLKLGGPKLSQGEIVAFTAWPKYDSTLLVDDCIHIIVQVNGKFRDSITIPRYLIKEETEILKQVQQSTKVTNAIKNQPILRTIYVPGKIINILT